MPFSADVFRHVPALTDLVTPPDVSEMRFGQDRFDELDAQALAEGWPPGWRMDHDAREANRQAVLGPRMGQDLWVFGYGSLIWDPAVEVAEYRYAKLAGWHRAFCMKLEGGRGTREVPGLMAALDQGGQCEGVVLRIPTAVVDCETRFMWRREMFSGAYRPVFMVVNTPQGPVEALVFVMERENHRYTPNLPIETAAQTIAVAEGSLGPNFAYLDSMITHLEVLGIRDDAMTRLHSIARDFRAESGLGVSD